MVTSMLGGAARVLFGRARSRVGRRRRVSLTRILYTVSCVHPVGKWRRPLFPAAGGLHLLLLLLRRVQLQEGCYIPPAGRHPHASQRPSRLHDGGGDVAQHRGRPRDPTAISQGCPWPGNRTERCIARPGAAICGSICRCPGVVAAADHSRGITAPHRALAAAGLAMAYKLIEPAQTRWRAVNAPHLVALVRAGTLFHNGKLLERPIDITPTEPSESTETEVA
jgi:hypothetical protein